VRSVVLSQERIAALFRSGHGRVGSGRSPMQKKGIPGYFRVMVGAFEVTSLFDGGVRSTADSERRNRARCNRWCVRIWAIRSTFAVRLWASLSNTGAEAHS